MAVKGVDFSWDKPNGKELYNAGYRFVVGYESPQSGKNVSKAQVDAYRAAHLAVGFVEEDSGRELLGSSGPSLVKSADAKMKAIGVPETVPLFVAVDFNPTSAQLPVLAAHIKAARAAVARPVGIYGSYRLLKYLFDNHVIEWGWQTYAWSNGARDPRAQFYQYSNNHQLAGGTVDYDYEEISGALWAGVPVPPPAPAKPVAVGAYPGHTLMVGGAHNVVTEVKQIQEKLNANGYHVSADGSYGPATAKVVEAFQAAEHLTKDGEVGPITWAAVAKLPK